MNEKRRKEDEEDEEILCLNKFSESYVCGKNRSDFGLGLKDDRPNAFNFSFISDSGVFLWIRAINHLTLYQGLSQVCFGCST